jgi:hypothetical protein
MQNYTIRTNALTIGTVITEEPTFKLYNGRYEDKMVTILQLSSQLFTECRESLNALAQSASPFWLPIMGMCDGTDARAVVLNAWPETCFDAWLASIV